MKTNRFKGNKTIHKILIGFLLMIFIIVSLCVVLIDKGNTIANKEVKKYLSEISQQTTYKVNERIQLNIDKLTMIAKTMNRMEAVQQQAYIEDVLSSTSFSWIGVLSQEGVVTLQDGTSKDYGDIEVIQQAMKGTRGVGVEMVEGINHDLGVIYAVPFVQDQKKTVLVGWVAKDTMSLLMDTDTFDGLGFSHIVLKDGTFIIRSNNENALHRGTNFFSMIENKGSVKSGYSMDKVRQDMQKGKSGELRFYTDKNMERVLIYTPLEYVDWYLCSVVPPAVYTKGIGAYINQSVVIVASVMFVLFVIFFLMVNLITRKKNKEIMQIAFVDPITNGYSQPKFEIEVEKRQKEKIPFAFLSLDIKQFKLINDSFGSVGGDQVLRYIHDCILKELNKGEFVSRVNADNFNILLNTVEKEEINKRLSHIAEEINSYNAQREIPYYLVLTCGTFIVNDCLESIVLIRDRANTARKSIVLSKEQALCTNAYYVDVVRLNMIKEKEIENSMEKALRQHDFVVYLQPKVAPNSGKIVAAEALVRWLHPQKGLIPPDEFIPLFEHNGFILKLDLYVFEEVCKVIHKWITNGETPIPIAINLSRNHLYYPQFLKDYKKLQEKYEVPSKYLEIELTETLAFENLDLLKKAIKEIHELGYRCSMDDFGSGYSSLNVLKEVPVDVLKIDKIFFDNGFNQRSNDVVDFIIQLAKKLGMETVAEGVETKEQLQLLQTLNCDMIQGYIFAKPMPISAFEDVWKKKTSLLDFDARINK